jgi:hypothetical protein
MPPRKLEKCDSPGNQFEPFAPQFTEPFPLVKSTKKKELRVMRHHAVSFESLPAFRRRMVDQFTAQLATHCRYLRASKLLPGTLPRKSVRDAWFASELDKGKTIREIQDAWFDDARELVSEPAIRKAIQRVRTKPGRS